MDPIEAEAAGAYFTAWEQAVAERDALRKELERMTKRLGNETRLRRRMKNAQLEAHTLREENTRLREWVDMVLRREGILRVLTKNQWREGAALFPGGEVTDYKAEAHLLTKERDAAVAERDDWKRQFGVNSAAASALQAENERLRGALGRIVADVWNSDARVFRDIARAALEKGET